MIIGEPEYIYLLWLFPILAGVGIVAGWHRGKRLKTWADRKLWGRLSPSRSRPLRALRYFLALMAMTFALGAAIRPQAGAQLVQVERQGMDVMVLLDVSLSMEATDVVPSRMDRSKQEIRELLDQLQGDRVGIVIFAGSSFLLCPLTLDVAAANMFLDAVSVDILPNPGTNMEAALDGARRAFEVAEETGGARVVVVFTDGEGHEGAPLTSARALKNMGIPVITVGVGTPGGEPIPVRDAGGRVVGFKKDRGGNVVLSRLDEGILKQVARETGGRYYPATLQGQEVGRIVEYLGRLERGELGGAIRRRVEERFQIPAGIATVLLMLALLVPEGRKNPEPGTDPAGGMMS